MNRIKIVNIYIWLFLLCLFPALVQSQSLTSYEYWFDDDFNGRQSGSLSGNEDCIDLGIETDQLDNGIHKLCFRVRQKDGYYSAISSSLFLKRSAGKAYKMEYWIDTDYENAHTISGVLDSDSQNYVFIDSLDLSGVSPGHHRLSFQPISDNKEITGARTSIPIIVQSGERPYNSIIKMTSYSILVDGEEIDSRDYINPEDELEMWHILDARNLSEGEHSLEAQLWNSAYTFASVEHSFKVESRTEPNVILSGTENNGLVELQFTPVPNDLRYRIIRTDINGVKVKVDSKEGGIYPTKVVFKDNPAAGIYTYYVQTVYTDYSGVQHTLTSNEISLQVSSPQTETVSNVDFGYITGIISCDLNTPMNGLRVSFSDGETSNVSFSRFSRIKIPVGTVLTLNVEGDDSHEYDSVTITVKKGLNHVVLHGVNLEEYQPSNLENDIGINSAIELMERNGLHYAKFSIRNLSHAKDWKGIVRIKVIDRLKADDMNIEIAAASYETNNLYVGESDTVQIGGNSSKEMTVLLRGVKPKKDTDFYLYFESVGQWTESKLPANTKPLAANYNYACNPIVRTIGKTGQNTVDWDSGNAEQFAYMMVGLSSLISGLDGMAGDLSSFYDNALSAAKELTHELNDEKAIIGLFEWLLGKTALEAMAEPSLYNLSSAVFDTYRTSQRVTRKTFVQKYWKDILNVSCDLRLATLMTHEVAGIALTMKTNDPIEASLACSNMLYGLVYSGDNVPYASMMYAYQVVGKSMISKASQYVAIMHDFYLSERLRANKPFNGEKIGNNTNRMNTAVDFKIAVKTGKKAKTCIDFTKTNAQEQIKDVVVLARNNSVYPATVFHFNMIFQKDGIMLESNGKVENINGISMSYKPLNEFCLLIYWANGRQTVIPLNEVCDGIRINLSNCIQTDDFKKYSPSVYTVTLTTDTGLENMADELFLGNNKKRK